MGEGITAGSAWNILNNAPSYQNTASSTTFIVRDHNMVALDGTFNLFVLAPSPTSTASSPYWCARNTGSTSVIFNSFGRVGYTTSNPSTETIRIFLNEPHPSGGAIFSSWSRVTTTTRFLH